MKLPVEWLREHVPTPLSDEKLAEALTMAGLEVEETTNSGQGSVFHTKVTPNRGDWLSVVGSAREAAAALALPFLENSPPLPEEAPDVQRWAGVRVENAALCPRYAGKVVRNVRLAPSPPWMQARLTAAGMRPVNAVVDITNYVMLEMGQPLHAFDYDTLPQGQIIVRTARLGERIVTLDGVDRALSPDMLAICDLNGPIALAGVMGGAVSEVSDGTRHLFLESAHFDAGSVRRTSKQLGLSTEASYRFERYVDPELAPVALERACEMLADLAGAEVVLGRIDLYPRPAAPLTLSLRPARVNAILGMDLQVPVIADSLRRLGLAVGAETDTLSVTVPTFRPDLVAEIDLIEEVGRMVGYAALPETLPPARAEQGGVDNPESVFAAHIRALITGLGLQEALTNSLTAPSPFDGEDGAKRVTIRQALSADLSGLRVSLAPHLLESLVRNLRHREARVALFEVGKVFARGDAPGEYRETRRLGAVVTGPTEAPSWREPHPPMADLFFVKGVAEAIAQFLRLPPLAFAAAARAGMHAGRCASVLVGGASIGYVAEVDPAAVKADLDAPSGTGRIAVLELDMDALMSLRETAPRYRALPRFPSVSRDLAVVVDSSAPFANLRDVAQAACDPNLLQGVELVSVYEGERIGPGRKSVALRLTFRAEDRTLTDADVDAQVAAAQARLAAEAGAALR